MQQKRAKLIDSELQENSDKIKICFTERRYKFVSSTDTLSTWRENFIIVIRLGRGHNLQHVSNKKQSKYTTDSKKMGIIETWEENSWPGNLVEY